jgi:hypothetical protein
MKTLLLLAVFLISFQAAFAEDIVMSSEQSTYYFALGENAVIPIDVENNNGEFISGMLQYTLTQEIRQGNTQFSSSNTKASTLTINEGKQTLSLDFGTSNNPSDMKVNLRFNYNDGNEMNVSLGPIEIIFVAEDSQKNNTANKIQSSSQQGPTTPQNNQFNPQQSMQQRLDELFNQSPMSQDPQQRLQNNQLNQDSSALKQQIQKQLQKENEMQTEFEKNIVSDEKFQQLHQQMLDEGYNFTRGSLNPTTNSTGTFEANYENSEEKWGKIQGSVINGTITDIQKQTQEGQEYLLSKLRNDPQFQEYEQQLIKEGYVEQTIQYTTEQNNTSILIEYQNEDFQTSKITGDFQNDELVSVKLDKENGNQFDILPLLIVVLIGITTAFLYLKLRVKKPIPNKPLTQLIPQKRFDYLLESNKLLQEGKENFKRQEFKDAYGKVGQAIRLFLSYKLNLKKEITNEDLLRFLKNTDYPVKDIENCLWKSSLVEFAKSKPNKNEFEEMVVLAKTIIGK